MGAPFPLASHNEWDPQEGCGLLGPGVGGRAPGLGVLLVLERVGRGLNSLSVSDLLAHGL